MESFLIKALQLVMSLSLLVMVHECGHFLFARLFKVRVEKFYLFFNPWFSLFKYPRHPKEGQTQFGIGWLPLGGYVKIAGMIDESMDTEQMSQPVQPWEFRAKPATQRLLIMVGGVLFNFLLALFIYSMIVFTWGDSYIPLRDAKQGMEFSQAALDAGFQNGDILISADGEVLEQLSGETVRTISEAKEVTVMRQGKEVVIEMPEKFLLQLIKENKGFASFITPAVINQVVAGAGAEAAGLAAGDSIVAINQTATPTYADVAMLISSNKGEEVELSIYRNQVAMNIPVQVDTLGKVGIAFEPLTYFVEPVTVNYTLLESFPKGIERGVNTLKGYVSDMKYLFTKEGANSLGGFAAIGGLFPDMWNWQIFWNMTALLSIMLAFMNILPIPALDGGHVLFLLYEVITRRQPSEKFMEYAQTAGMIILIALMLFANGNDLFKFLFK